VLQPASVAPQSDKNRPAESVRLCLHAPNVGALLDDARSGPSAPTAPSPRQPSLTSVTSRKKNLRQPFLRFVYFRQNLQCISTPLRNR